MGNPPAFGLFVRIDLNSLGEIPENGVAHAHGRTATNAKPLLDILQCQPVAGGLHLKRQL